MPTSSWMLLPCGFDGKISASNEGNTVLIPRSGRTPGGGHGKRIQYSCWEMPRTEEPGGLQTMGVTKCRIQLRLTLPDPIVLEWLIKPQFSSVQSLSHVRLCQPMNRSTPGLPVHHQLPEFTQTPVHRVGDAIQPSHPVVPFSSCPQSLPASESFPMSQLFT